jgi:hypothetical protein
MHSLVDELLSCILGGRANNENTKDPTTLTNFEQPRKCDLIKGVLIFFILTVPKWLLNCARRATAFLSLFFLSPLAWPNNFICTHSHYWKTQRAVFSADTSSRSFFLSTLTELKRLSEMIVVYKKY